MIAVVRYDVGTYSGEVRVQCGPDDETATVIARAKRAVARCTGGPLPFGAESWCEVGRIEEDEETSW